MIRVGALAPLSWPGLVPAGRDLRAGMELAAEELNSSRSGDARIELLVCDTRGEPAEGVAAVDDLVAAGVVALVGEFHSVVADAVAERVEELAIPFVCSSATLDQLTARHPRWLFRVAPPQSHGWRIYAEVIAGLGSQNVVLAVNRDVYWDSGAAVLERALRACGVGVDRVEVGDAAQAAELLVAKPTVDTVLLLVGYPEPLCSLVRLLHRARPDVLLGDPAGRAAFADWWEWVGADGVGVPFLSYLPERLSPRGSAFAGRFRECHGREPTFVAFEGYDTLVVLEAALARGSEASAGLREALSSVHVAATRGRISFARGAGVEHHQWVWPPVRVVAAPCTGATANQAVSLARVDGQSRGHRPSAAADA